MPSGRWLAILAALVVLGGGYWYWRQPRPVPTAMVTRGDIAEIVYATGTVEPLTWSKVLPLLRARIVEHCACEGRVVRKGEVLGRLDDTAAQAELRQVIAKRDFAASEVARHSELISRGAATRQVLERAEAELRQLDSQIAALTARLTDYLLVAPKDGVVLRADGQVGDIPGTNDVLFWVGQPKPLQIVAEINEEDIAKVVLGQVALLRNDGFPEGKLAGTISAITPKGDPATKTFRAYIALPAETPLRIGMSIEANIVVRERKGVLLVPLEAVSALAGKSGQVFVFEDGKLVARKVTIGLKGSRFAEVLEGPGEGTVVAAPVRPEMKDGLAVRPAK